MFSLRREFLLNLFVCVSVLIVFSTPDILLSEIKNNPTLQNILRLKHYFLENPPVEALTRNLPPKFDWSEHVTSPRNQWGCGSCVVFAATGILEAKVQIALDLNGDVVDLSEQHLMSCEGSGGCKEEVGWDPSRVFNYIEESGVPTEKCFPAYGVDAPCKLTCDNWQEQAYKITDWNSVEFD